MFRVYRNDTLEIETEDYIEARNKAEEIAKEGDTGIVKELTMKEGLGYFKTFKTVLPSVSAINARIKREMDTWG